MSEGITFRAYFSKASTLVDGGWRISFDLSGDLGKVAAQVAALGGQDLQIAIVPVETLADPLETITHG